MSAPLSLQEYLQTVQSFIESTPDLLIDYIDEQIAEVEEKDPSFQAILRGERAFFQQDYKQALKEYMQARDLPAFQFFCYRTCAYHFNAEKHPIKALDFAEKALGIFGGDRPSLELAIRLYEESGQAERAAELRQRINGSSKENAEAADDETSVESSDQLQVVSLGSEEFTELTQLFEETTDSETASVEAAEETIVDSELKQETPRPRSVTDPQLQQRVHYFHSNQLEQIKQYLQEEQHALQLDEDLFQVLHGWHREESRGTPFDLILPNALHRGGGGYFLRWKGHGIAINPSQHFLSSFHQAGYRLADINSVLVTRSDPESYAEVKDIYELNALLNRSRTNKHLIRYYLNPQAYQILGALLVPHYKEEKHSVHCLELFLDAPEAEELKLSEHIHLHYFPTSAQNVMPPSPYTPTASAPRFTALGIRLDLRGTEQTTQTMIGYASGAPWSPFLAEHLQGCDMLIVGIGHTDLSDIAKERYPTNSLGYYGASSLQEELKPKVLILGEFHGADPDLRIELTRRLLQEQPSTHRGAVLPGDTRLVFQLPTGNVRCTASGTYVAASDAKVVRSAERYGSLHYLAPQHLI